MGGQAAHKEEEGLREGAMQHANEDAEEHRVPVPRHRRGWAMGHGIDSRTAQLHQEGVTGHETAGCISPQVSPQP